MEYHHDKRYHREARFLGTPRDALCEGLLQLPRLPQPLPVPTNFTGTATEKDAAGRLVLDLDWDDVLPGTGITYEVQQKRGKRLWELWESEWETLPFNVYSIHFNGSEAEIRYPVDGRDYEHRVRSVNAHSYHSEWASIKTTVPAGIPHLGHQADHTVKYEASTTYPPTSDISNAISTAATAWDNAVGGSWPNLRVCKSGSTDCNVRNTDGHTVTIDVVSGEESPGKGSEKGLLIASIPHFGDADCGAKVACVKPRGIGDAGAFISFGSDGGKSAPWQHMENLTMVIEEPA